MLIENNKNNGNATATFLSKVVANDAFKRGVAGAIAGVLVAAISTALWEE